jgi:putative FmdB family regulatory protein
LPLYEYECIQNGHRFELIRQFSDPELRRCIKCKSKVKRLLSAPAISFKGSGWYITDYARGGSANESNKDRKDAKDQKDQKPQKDSKDSKESKDSKDSKESKPAEKSSSKSTGDSGSSSSKKD